MMYKVRVYIVPEKHIDGSSVISIGKSETRLGRPCESADQKIHRPVWNHFPSRTSNVAIVNDNLFGNHDRVNEVSRVIN